MGKEDNGMKKQNDSPESPAGSSEPQGVKNLRKGKSKKRGASGTPIGATALSSLAAARDGGTSLGETAKDLAAELQDAQRFGTPSGATTLVKIGGKDARPHGFGTPSGATTVVPLSTPQQDERPHGFGTPSGATTVESLPAKQQVTPQGATKGGMKNMEEPGTPLGEPSGIGEFSTPIEEVEDMDAAEVVSIKSSSSRSPDFLAGLVNDDQIGIESLIRDRVEHWDVAHERSPILGKGKKRKIDDVEFESPIRDDLNLSRDFLSRAEDIIEELKNKFQDDMETVGKVTELEEAIGLTRRKIKLAMIKLNETHKTQAERNLIITSILERITELPNKDWAIHDVRTLMDDEWPEEVYHKVEVSNISIWNTNKDNDVVIIRGHETEDSDGLTRQLQRCYPELYADTEDYTMIEQVTRKRGSNDVNIRRRHSVRNEVPVSKGQISESFLQGLLKLRECVEEEGIIQINVVIADKSDTELIRKLLEMAFSGRTASVTIHAPNRLTETGKRGTINQDEAIILKAEGKTYADLVKSVRSNLYKEEIGPNVKSIRKTQAGSLMITVNDGAGELLKERIKEKINDMEVIHRLPKRGVRTIRVADLDPAVTADEIVEAIKESTGLTDKDIHVTRIIQSARDTQMAFVDMDAAVADKLMTIKRIRVGWTMSRISEKVSFSKCYRCWDYSHLENECKGPDRRKCCLKCGQEGHRAGQCSNPPRCPICQANGHRYDSMNCEAYRQQWVRFGSGTTWRRKEGDKHL